MDILAFKALSDSTRLTIIGLLHDRVYCVKALALKLNLSEPAISQHMKILRDAGLVEGVKFGYYTHYRLDREALAALGQSLIDTAQRPETKPECDAQAVIGCKSAPKGSPANS